MVFFFFKLKLHLMCLTFLYSSLKLKTNFSNVDKNTFERIQELCLTI